LFILFFYYFILSLLSHLFFYREKWRLYLRKGWLLNGMGGTCRGLCLCDGRVYAHSQSNICMLQIRMGWCVCLCFLKMNPDSLCALVEYLDYGIYPFYATVSTIIFLILRTSSIAGSRC